VGSKVCRARGARGARVPLWGKGPVSALTGGGSAGKTGCAGRTRGRETGGERGGGPGAPREGAAAPVAAPGGTRACAAVRLARGRRAWAGHDGWRLPCSAAARAPGGCAIATRTRAPDNAASARQGWRVGAVKPPCSTGCRGGVLCRAHRTRGRGSVRALAHAQGGPPRRAGGAGARGRRGQGRAASSKAMRRQSCRTARELAWEREAATVPPPATESGKQQEGTAPGGRAGVAPAGGRTGLPAGTLRVRVLRRPAARGGAPGGGAGW
jgi:hypothetical protein